MGKDGGQLNEEQRTALDVFTRDGDRGYTHIFVGREAELQLIGSRISKLVDKRHSHRPGADLTVVVQGAPGAGKSALLEKIEEDWPLGEKGKPVAIRIAASALKLPMGELLAIISRQVNSDSAIRRTLASFRSISVNPAGIANFTADMDSSQPGGKSLTPIILLFDEIQSVLADGVLEQSRECLRDNLELLHTGEHGVPIFPVYGGLANSADLLRMAGLTRLAMGSELTLPGFRDDEMNELMMRFVDKHLSSAKPSQAVIGCWSEAFRRDSQGWPMHCRNFLIALCKEIREKDWQPHEANLDTVRMYAQQLRFMYYAQRMQGALDERFALVSRALEAMRRGAPKKRGQIVQLVAKAHQDSLGEDSGWSPLPHGMTAEQAFDAMLHSGIVQKTGKGKFSCPIPSLASYIAARATLPPSPLHEAVLDDEAADMDHALDLCRDDEERAKLLHAADIRGRTPLMLAVELGMAAMVEHLVKAESRLPAALRSVKSGDSAGRTARDYATASGDDRMVALLNRIQPHID